MDEELTPQPEVSAIQPEEEEDRLAQPVDAEEPPRLPFPVVGIGASAGGLEAVSEFLDAMHPDAGIAFVLVQHLPPDRESLMAEILHRRTAMPVLQVEDGMAVEPDHVYVIRPGHLLTIRDGLLHLGPPLGTKRAANRPVDDFFKSLAEEQRERGIAIIMSGMGSNGTAGAQAIKAVGGLCIAQDPESAQFPSMPRHLIDAGYADYILRPADMPDVLLAYASHPYASGGREADAEVALQRDRQHLREVLALLRTRTRRDFSGYKKPTLLRRVQRRMGLTRVASMAEYARLLRQSPGEVASLADDLLIHVTGFFRDPEAWEALRSEVIVPLVAAREPGASVRGWVTACSSGEEAYTLAMLLTEESERAGKALDIKVFATDLAERALAHARAGVYPGGIESEMSPERLLRYFTRDDAVYRIKAELRDRVVFAPQNVLQDPPFSRLDIATCRNLLIYLEPEVQQRVMGLLHFGLREGGALFLGSSETVAGSDHLFETIDKKARIFRRIGPTRHGTVDFPLPHAFLTAAGGRDTGLLDGRARARPKRPVGASPSLVDRARRTLLESHTPPAVTVDLDGRVLQFHGDTNPFLRQPAGEPTRDLLIMTREGLRGAVRVALQQAAAANARACVPDGWTDVGPGSRMRVAVTASPLAPDPATGSRAGQADHFVVSFEERGIAAPDPKAQAVSASPDDELRRVCEEYHGAIEELQASNEELKAAQEEAVSVNEELQSANEELETSKEEMQSLNEELATVNAQLRAKVEEIQATSSDLSSLLASTDLAVLFLDTSLRIRRYTPAVRDLVDLIAGDVGRPLSALARRFDDPLLDDDARAVMDRLATIEREINGSDGRLYLRRVTPYRTMDNRIDGVVVTFVDITARERAERGRRASEEQFRRAIEEAPIPVIMQAEDGQVLQLSRTWTELTGYALADLPTLDTWLTRAYGPGADSVRAYMHELFQGDRQTIDVEFTIRTRDGADRLWSFSASAPGTLWDGRRFLVGMAVDVTDRRRIEAQLREGQERQAFLLRLSDALRTLDDRIEIQRVAMRMLGERIIATRVFYFHTEPAEGGDWTHVIEFDYRRDPGMPSVVGRHSVNDFGISLLEGAMQGKVVAIGDVTKVPLISEAVLRRLLAIDAAAFVSVPLIKNGLFVAGIGVHDAVPRAWNPSEIDLVQEVAERTWEAVERARAEQDLRASEERLRAVAQNLPKGAAFVVGHNLRYTLAGGDALGMAGFTPAELEGKTVAEAMGPELADEYERQYLRALAGETLHSEHEAHGRHYITHLAPLRDAAGAVSAALAVSYDITDRVQAEATARESGELFRLVVENVRDYAIFFMDPAGRVAGWWEGAERMLGYRADEVIGTSADRLSPSDDRTVGVFARELREATETGRATEEGWLIRKNGDRFWASGAVTALRDPAGGLRGFVKIFRDETVVRAAEADVREARDRLQLALAAARMGIWLWDPTTGIHTRDANLNRLLGLEPVETVLPLDEFLDHHVYSGDREAVARAFGSSVNKGHPLNIEFRIQRPDGKIRWLRDQGDIFGGPDVPGRHMAGACVDVTDLKEAEEELRRARDELEVRVAERTDELARANVALQEGLAARKELLGRVVTAQEDERRRISRELHDGLGQELTALILGLKALEQNVLRDDEGRARLLEVEATINRIGREAHDLAVELRPTALDDIGLSAALSAYVAWWSDRTGVAADFQPLGLDGDRLPTEVESTVYRVVQEALNNVVKHAEAKLVSVIVERRGNELTALVEDDGRGFDPERVDSTSGRRSLGLLGMRERTGLVGGSLLIESAEGKGTTVRVRMPLGPAAKEANHGG